MKKLQMKTKKMFNAGIISICLFISLGKANGQEFFSGTKSTTASISRIGSTTFGSVLLRGGTSTVQVLEHVSDAGDFYIRSVAYQIPGDTGNLILNDIDGFVGIGTSKPKEKLSVNGNIRAREIKVETSNWPDYVFKE